MVKFFIGFVAVILFLVEPVFSLFSPFSFGEHIVYIIPRFLILYFIFLAIYYNRKVAIIYGFIFGLLYDVFYIDIIGLYTVLYPLICFIAGAVVKVIHKHMIVAAIISTMLITLLEFVIYHFNFYIGHTSMVMNNFIFYRLISTLIANSLFIALLMLIFSVLTNKRIFDENV